LSGWISSDVGHFKKFKMVLKWPVSLPTYLNLKEFNPELGIPISNPRAAISESG